ncbi:MAG: hypothetical protein D6731_02050 [Planctomycetota bacterium]|nr:MAG: hypothetical protein D6731_02050 [Planctomycetota bacterium]
MGTPELPETEGFTKPTPPRRHYSLRELRDAVSARHKAQATTGPFAEAVALVQEHYGADASSAAEFVAWLRGEAYEGQPPKGNAVERVHVRTDPATGEERRLDTQPGSIPPRG